MESNPAGTLPTPDLAPQPAPRRLFRSSTNRVFSGVCAGVADYFGGDPTMVRLATVVIGLLTGVLPMVILYIVAAIVVPERGIADGQDTAAYSRPARAGNGALIAGVFFISVGCLAFMHEVMRIDTDLLWPFGLIATGAAFILITFRR